jgi:hypothetical protein
LFNPHDRKGIAIVMVIALVAVVVPLLFMLSRIGRSQIKQAKKYNENLLTETVTLSGSNAGISRLRGNLRGYQDHPEEIMGEYKYSLNLSPTGKGFFSQDLYYLFSKSQINNHSNILMAEAEQFNPEPDPPVLVITRDYWNTVEPYEINELADVLSMQNYRGLEMLKYDETRKYELNTTKQDYKQDFLGKKTNLPDEIRDDWNNIVEVIADEKLGE